MYAATFESGKPFQGPVTVLLKEFTPSCRQIGLNELQLARQVKVPLSYITNSLALLCRLPDVALIAEHRNLPPYHPILMVL